MKVIENTLKIEVETWDDPGDYPSGAGSCPLPSYDFVCAVAGTVVVELEDADNAKIRDYADVDMTYTRMVEAWLRESPSSIDPEIPGLRVTSWCLESFANNRLTLSVDEFDASGVSLEPDCDDDVFSSEV